MLDGMGQEEREVEGRGKGNGVEDYNNQNS
jgi:hypothetical protein